MNILSEILSSLDFEVPVRSVLVGAHWTVVCSRQCGLASTVIGDKPHGHERVRDVGCLHQKSAQELAEYSLSDNLLEASIGLAAINSLLQIDSQGMVEVNASEVLAEYGRDRKVAIVGHFPFIPSLRQVAGELWVIEQHPIEGEFLAEDAVGIIPKADIVALTGTTLINHTLDGLLALCRRDALVMILGPTTPISPVLFHYGVTFISGARVINEEAVMHTVGQGAIFPQVEGVRLLTLSKSREFV